MALIRNGGKYQVKVAVSPKQWKPGDEPSLVLNWNDIGSGVEDIPENECRYVEARRVEGAETENVYAIVAGEDNYVIASARIGPHDFLEFNGEKFLDVNQATGDCKKNHGW